MPTETASQTAGPYLHIGMAPWAAGIEIRRDEQLDVLARGGAAGERIRLEGMIFDGTGTPVRDAMVEIWQANAHGKDIIRRTGRTGPRTRPFAASAGR